MRTGSDFDAADFGVGDVGCIGGVLRLVIEGQGEGFARASDADVHSASTKIDLRPDQRHLRKRF